MTRHSLRNSTTIGIVTVTALAALAPINSASGQQPSDPPSFQQPMPLHPTLGNFKRKITTSVPEAQAYFDQGVRLIYAFNMQEASRSFREAQKRDPNCAMCFFGEAWSWGAYLNGALNAGNSPRAYAAIQQAVKLRDKGTRVEQELIDAMAVRYVAVHDNATRAKLDTAYSAAMEKVYVRFKSDMEVGFLYAESLMLLNRSRGLYRLEQPNVQKFHAVLDALLDRNLDHPGVCHIYIHATEATQKPDLAEACALLLGNTIPGASHINHMPSHTFNRIGRWGDAVKANLEAWHTDLKAGTGEGVSYSAGHNLHMLLFAAAYDGQGAISTQASRDFAKITPRGTQHIALTLTRFGRFDEVLELTLAPTNEVSRAEWEFARGYAHLRRNAVDSARFYLARVDSIGRGMGAGRGGGPAASNNLIAIVSAILRAELLVKDGKLDEAIPVLEAAGKVEDDMAYSEPEALPFASRHWLGAVFLEAKRPADAERVYREDLIKHPRNGWSLFGLAQALTAQGKNSEAEKVRVQFEESWARSDTWLRGSRF